MLMVTNYEYNALHMRKTTLVQQTLNTLSRSETPMTAPSILESLNQQ